MGSLSSPFTSVTVSKFQKNPAVGDICMPVSHGGLGGGACQKKCQKNRVGTGLSRLNRPCSFPIKTHNRRQTEPYSIDSSALIIPWSCVRVTPGLLLFDALFARAEWLPEGAGFGCRFRPTYQKNLSNVPNGEATASLRPTWAATDTLTLYHHGSFQIN